MLFTPSWNVLTLCHTVLHEFTCRLYIFPSPDRISKHRLHVNTRWEQGQHLLHMYIHMYVCIIQLDCVFAYTQFTSLAAAMPLWVSCVTQNISTRLIHSTEPPTHTYTHIALHSDLILISFFQSLSWTLSRSLWPLSRPYLSLSLPLSLSLIVSPL